MPKFVIEREIPSIGSAGPTQLAGAAQASNKALDELGTQIQWLESYVVSDRTYCIYIAPSEELIRRHAELSGFPANRISEVKAVIDPTTADSPTPG